MLFKNVEDLLNQVTNIAHYVKQNNLSGHMPQVSTIKLMDMLMETIREYQSSTTGKVHVTVGINKIPELFRCTMDTSIIQQLKPIVNNTGRMWCGDEDGEPFEWDDDEKEEDGNVIKEEN